MKTIIKMAQEAGIIPLNVECDPSYLPVIERFAALVREDALAQPEQKKPQNCGTGYCSCIECVMKPKPRAWLIEFENGAEELHFDAQSVGEIHTPLYTSSIIQSYLEKDNSQLAPAPVLVQMRVGTTWATVDKPTVKEQKEKAQRLMRNYPGVYEMRELVIATQPAAQRTWVGLTTAQRKEIERQSVYVDGAIRMTEAKLKEKNDR